MLLQLSRAGLHLDSPSVFRLDKIKRQALVLPHRDVFGVVAPRRFWPCAFDGTNYLADIVTGTLYDEATGRCASSRHMAVLKEAQAAPTPKRRSKAQAAEGWINDKRRAA